MPSNAHFPQVGPNSSEWRRTHPTLTKHNITMWRNRWRGHFANFYARLDTAVMLARNDRAKFAAIAK